MTLKKIDISECDCKDKRRKLYRRLCAGFLIFTAIILFIVLLIFLILHPTKPRFILQDATVYALNVSSPNFLTSNMQVTISSRNPNERIGIYYDKLHVVATYRNQQFTYPTILPATYQGHKDTDVWSPFLYGTSVPVAPYIAVGLSQDQSAGVVLLNIKIDGRVRWKVGTWISGRYHLHVKCPAYITFGSRNTGIPVGAAVKYQLVKACNVDV
ncbi:hypothetical protein HHK36_019402 [Tetracentron sinense]|uniref:Late embryogenesis abundant protein LEA-2 subgroup domain-containing protein n=1 Tax=Tetracentron sinense TaxID=13715 RepID=A0A834YZ57_TETSI|nr:hypothetical protein HHK36_019402 [Tetracentron sinense]